MTHTEIKQFLDHSITLVLTLHRRTTYAIQGDLAYDIDPLTNEMMYDVYTRQGVYRFPIEDVHSVENSVDKGIVIRLTN